MPYETISLMYPLGQLIYTLPTCIVVSLQKVVAKPRLEIYMCSSKVFDSVLSQLYLNMNKEGRVRVVSKRNKTMRFSRKVKYTIVPRPNISNFHLIHSLAFRFYSQTYSISGSSPA